MNKPTFIATPIYYVNDRPHIGHTYTTVVADTMARFYRDRGEQVFLSVGVDENSQKNVQAMEKVGETDLSVYLDRMANVWKETWVELGISFDDFIRTTDARHIQCVEKFWAAVQANGDIYEGEYTGLYCVGCEAFKTESDLVDGRCPLHLNKDLEEVRERNYFFRASKYRDALLAHIETHPEFIQPQSRRNEIVQYITHHFSDFSISREAKHLQVGIPVPGDATQRIYVWFDALLNYLTVIGYGSNDAMFQATWPMSIHIGGKDILKFHCALFPAMLMSAAVHDDQLRGADGNALLPERIFSHGFFTIDGQKISKSLGNAIDPRDLISTYGFDAIRYFLLREIPFGEDGDFSHTRLRERYIHDLSNTLGNLLNRIVAMSRSYFDGAVPSPKTMDPQWTFANEEQMLRLREQVDAHYQNVRIDLALETIWSGIDGQTGLLPANKCIEDTQPFKLVKENPEAVATILYSLLEYCREVAWLIEPVLPETASRMISTLGQNIVLEKQKSFAERMAWGSLPMGLPLPKPDILFPPLG